MYIEILVSCWKIEPHLLMRPSWQLSNKFNIYIVFKNSRTSLFQILGVVEEDEESVKI